MTRKPKRKKDPAEKEKEEDRKDDLDLFLSQARLRDRVMKEMIRKLQKSETTENNNAKQITKSKN
jgi:hypothetical protein